MSAHGRLPVVTPSPRARAPPRADDALPNVLPSIFDDMPRETKHLLGELNDSRVLSQEHSRVQRRLRLAHDTREKKTMGVLGKAGGPSQAKSTEHFLETRRIAATLAVEQERTNRQRHVRRYNEQYNAERQAIKRADVFDVWGPTEPRTWKVYKDNIVRASKRNRNARVSIDIRRDTLDNGTVDKMVPSAQHVLRAVVLEVQEARADPTTHDPLVLDHLRLTRFPPEVCTLAELQQLSIMRNHIRHVDPSVGRMRSLRSVKLDHNQLRSMHPLCFLPNLQQLSICHNQLGAISDDVSRLTVLEDLYVTHNHLTELPGEIGGCQALSSLKLHNNRLLSLPSSISQLEKLRLLHADHNHITKLPACLRGLECLECLDLSHNCLSTLPSSICKLISLQALRVDNNRLECLPNEIGRCPLLVLLYLQNNNLHTLPPSICELQSLTLALHLEGNPWVSLPKDLWRFADVHRVRVNEDSLTLKQWLTDKF